MMSLISILVAATLAAPPPPPAPPAPDPPAAAFLSAVASGDLPAARAMLAAEVVIMDDRAGNPAPSSLEAFADYVRGCERTGLTSEADAGPPARTAAAVTWTCPSRGNADAFVWSEETRIVWIQFRMQPVQ